jgi:hypothetical protein
MPKEIFRQLQKVRVAGQKLQISRALKTQTERTAQRERSDQGHEGQGARGAEASRCRSGSTSDALPAAIKENSCIARQSRARARTA